VTLVSDFGAAFLFQGVGVSNVFIVAGLVVVFTPTDTKACKVRLVTSHYYTRTLLLASSLTRTSHLNHLLFLVFSPTRE
jgi:hypothetical protein